MLSPILRLLAIYLVVALVVFAFFNRERLGGVFGPDDTAEPGAAVLIEPTPPEPTPPAPAASSGPTLQTPAPPAASAPSADAFEAGLARARALYWQNDIPGAIAAYDALLGRYPGSETLHGELGNILFMSGQRIRAAGHYEAAGMAALRTGNVRQAQMLLAVLSGIDRAAAARLQQALEAKR